MECRQLRHQQQRQSEHLEQQSLPTRTYLPPVSLPSAPSDQALQPMHLHGHGMWILSSGTGQWDGHTIVNPQNPQRRDTHNLVPFGHMVMQYNTDNPGTWAFHCHLAFHLSQGMFMTFMERPDDITSPQIPETMKQTCTAWDVWTSKNIVNQIDSGA